MIDTDTYFRRSPSLLFRRISPENSIMHLPEARLLESGANFDAVLHEIVHSRSYTDLAGNKLPFKEAEFMWNSGVIGAHSTNVNLLKEALNLIDQMSSHNRAPSVHHIEQFAVGHFLNRTNLRSCSDVVYHYWYEYLKIPFRNKLPTLLSSVVERPIQERAELVWNSKPRADARRRVAMATRIALRSLGFRVRGWRAST